MHGWLYLHTKGTQTGLITGLSRAPLLAETRAVAGQAKKKVTAQVR